MSMLGAILGVTAFVGALVATLPARERMTWAFTNLSYYLMWVLVALWVVVLVDHLRRVRVNIVAWVRANAAGLGLALLLTIVVAASVPLRFTVLSDETNLVAVSKSLLFKHTTGNTTMGFWRFGNFYDISNEMPLRPLLFPFLAQLLHLGVGYRPENLFALNLLIFFALLVLCYRFVGRYHGAGRAMAAMVLITAQPVITLCATSAGFDLLAAFLVCLALGLAWRFVSDPSRTNLRLLWVTLLALTNVRYESFVYALAILVPLLLTRRISWRQIVADRTMYALSLITLLPAIWQRVLTIGRFPPPPSGARFSLDNVRANLQEWASHSVDLSRTVPYATVLNEISLALGVVLVVWWAIRLARRRTSWSTSHTVVRVSVGLCAACYVGIVLSLFSGQFALPSSARLFVLYAIGLSLLPFYVMHVVPAVGSIGRRLSPGGMVMASVVLLGVYHPVAIENRTINSQILVRKTAQLYEFFETRLRPNDVIIVDRPGQYTIYDHGAISFGYANDNVEPLTTSLRRRLFNEVYVVQDVEYATGRPVPGQELDTRFALVPVWEFQNSASEWVRVSTVDRQRLGSPSQP